MPPDPEAMLRRCDAALLIGDPALFLDHQALGAEKIDLGEEWTALTGLPFVWAFWAGRPGVLSRDALNALAAARDAGRGARPTRSPPPTAGRNAPRAARRYLRDNIRYSLGEREAAGLRTLLRARGAARPRRPRPPRPSSIRDGRRAGDGHPVMTIGRAGGEGARRRAARPRRGARAVSARADAAARPAGRRHPRPQASRRRRHLHHRPQRQLHERLRRALQLLRVLSSGRIGRGLRARLRGDLPEDRRDDRARRRPAAAAGRPQPDLPLAVVRGSVPRGEAALSGVPAARAVAAGGDPPLAAVAAAGAAGDRAADRGRARQHSRRRRRDSRRSRAQAAELLRQGHRRRVARRDAPRAPRRAADDGDDDVRHGRDRGGAARAPVPAARAAGRDRRLHRVHHLELSAASTPSSAAPRRPASSTCARSRSRASSSTTSTTCRRRG